MCNTEPLVEQELLTLPEHLSTSLVSSGVRVTRSLALYMFCTSLFVLLYIFFWSLCCLFFFDVRILITPLVSSNTSCLWYRSKLDLLTEEERIYIKHVIIQRYMFFDRIKVIAKQIKTHHYFLDEDMVFYDSKIVYM